MGKFVKGQSGNPAGRPKGSKNKGNLLRDYMYLIAEGTKDTTYEQLFVKKILHKALKEGNDKMLTLIAHYIYGLPKQVLDVKGNLTLTQILDEIEKGKNRAKDDEEED